MTVDDMESKPHARTPILSWDNLNYEVKTKDGTRQLLHNISGQVYAGELVAIMGSSGAGKTTLLNVLAGRVQGGRLATRTPTKRMLAFVEQDDLMFASLSVEETLMATQRLDKQRRVAETLRQLRLSHVKDTKIGGYGQRGVSGGERKRVSIGVEMVTDPKLLVLDEPSSGLDSSSAEMVVALAKEMAQQRQLCTLMTIHQPSTEMVARFDKLILLAQGKLVYMGPAKDALSYFESLGYPFNTSELLLNKSFASAATTNDLTDYSGKDQTWQCRCSRCKRLFSSSNVRDMTGEAAYLATFEPPPMNRWIDERDWLLCTRNSALVFGLFAECLVMMVFIGFVFFQLDNSQSSVQNRIGALFALTVQSTFPVVIPVMTVIMTGRDVLMRERSGGTYRMSSFFIAKSLSFFPLVFIPYFVMYTGIYFIAHFQYVAHKYFIGLGILSALLLDVAHIIAPVALATLMLISACIIMPTPGFMQNEFNGLEFTCGDSSAICYSSGKDVIDTRSSKAQLLNLVLGFAFYAVAYCLLRWMTKPRYLWI
ncbi:P-loop containing nucleoside triphosphate hydrolase protein [Linderina pennispora]|uniref:p-loop containing nucleoside triphosphate hydrolase protein n=1 Tax=Linderina pennispora TaxID=61395 RepID=A0A1Y1WIL1_9FUNG|nr:P-loop containing nucleoside triphosphate hydrolase protein [Linderina pennispora]ORX73367.1 P-loop containing nucleoside triphosphate hydrolase protein [Linderina pennispora]